MSPTGFKVYLIVLIAVGGVIVFDNRASDFHGKGKLKHVEIRFLGTSIQIFWIIDCRVDVGTSVSATRLKAFQ